VIVSPRAVPAGHSALLDRADAAISEARRRAAADIEDRVLAEASSV